MQLRRIRPGIAMACIVFAAAAAAQSNNAVVPSNPDNTELRHLGTFSGIELDATSDASFTVGPNSSITISGPANVLPFVHTEVRNGALRVWVDRGVRLSRPLKLAITAPSLQAIDIPGSSTIAASGLSEASLDIDVSGSGAVSASGSVKGLNIAVDGSGDVDVARVDAKTLEAAVSGSGSIRAHVSDAVTVSTDGAGDVKIDGNPAHRTVSRAGSGHVQFD